MAERVVVAMTGSPGWIYGMRTLQLLDIETDFEEWTGLSI